MRISIKKVWKDTLFLALALTVFLGITVFSVMRNPELLHEELDQAYHSLRLMEHKDPQCYVSLNLFGAILPVNTNPYTGAALAYLYLPFFYLAGVSVWTLKMPGIVLGCLVLVYAYLFAKTFFNRTTAVLTSLFMLATLPFYICSRTADLDIILSAFSMSSLYCFARWLDTKRTAFLWVLCFLLGAALWFKIVFVWMLAGLAAGFVLLFRKEVVLSRRALLGGAAAFLLGVSPLIYANTATNWGTVRKVAAAALNPVGKPGEQVYNSELLGNLAERAIQFKFLFSAGSVEQFVQHNGLAVPRTFAFVFWFSLAVVVIFAALNRGRSSGRRLALTAVLFSTIFIGLGFTLSTLRQLHLMFLFPLPCLIIALALYHAGSACVSRANAVAVRCLFCVVFVALAAGSARLLHSQVRMLGQWALHTDIFIPVPPDHRCAEEIGDYLIENNIGSVYALCDKQLLKLETFGKAAVSDFHNGFLDPRNNDLPSKFYVLKDRRLTPGNRSEPEADMNKMWRAFKSRYSVNMSTIAVSHDPEGAPVYTLLEVTVHGRKTP